MKEKWQDKLTRLRDNTQIWWEKNRGTILFWTGVGVIVNGIRKGSVAYKKIKEHEKWTDEEAIPTFNQNAAIAKRDQARIDELERRVDELYEKALSETEGKETA